MSFSVIQTIMGMIGSVGFAVLFGVRGRKLAVIALGSGAGWAVYLVCRAMGCSIFTGLLAAGLFVIWCRDIRKNLELTQGWCSQRQEPLLWGSYLLPIWQDFL